MLNDNDNDSEILNDADVTYLMIGKNFRIFRRDELNLEIQNLRLVEVNKNRFVKEKYSEEQWKTVGYAGSLKAAFQILLKKYINTSIASDLNSMVSMIEKVEKTLLDAIDDAGLTLQSFPKPADGRANNPGRAKKTPAEKAEKVKVVKSAPVNGVKRGRGRPPGSKKIDK